MSTRAIVARGGCPEHSRLSHVTNRIVNQSGYFCKGFCMSTRAIAARGGCPEQEEILGKKFERKLLEYHHTLFP